MVLCVDEKIQIQAIDRTQPLLPLAPGIPELALDRLGGRDHGSMCFRSELDAVILS